MLFEPGWKPPEQRTPYAFYFAFSKGYLLVPDETAGQLLPQEPSFCAGGSDPLFLGRLGGIDCWTLSFDEPPVGWRPTPLRTAMMSFPEDLSAMAGRASQIHEWNRTSRFCGVCGSPTVHHERERARVCPGCRFVMYPRVNPVMMALVWRPGEVLLARSPHFAVGMFSALAGFVEVGENIEQCLSREVAEEVSVQVDDLRYHSSQSWPFPHNLMIAFTARWTGGEIVPEAGEIEEAHWFPIDALPRVPPSFSIAGRLIGSTVERMRANGGEP